MTLDCNVCGKGFAAKRSDALFCSPRCRTEAHRRREDPSRTLPARRGRLSDDFRRRALDAYKVTEKLERLIEDDRFARNRRELASRFGPEVRLSLASLQRVADALGVTSE